MTKGTLRVKVFFPPFLLLTSGVVFCFFYPNFLLSLLTDIHHQLLLILGPLYSLVSFFMVITCVLVYFSPLGKIKIGGETATPTLTRWQWFSISLCGTIGCGILFWGTAEPLYHYFQPPVLKNSDRVFSLASLLLHWTFTPYAIYAVPALVFALNFHNHKSDMSFASCLQPLFSPSTVKKCRAIIDCLCLYSLVIGMAAALAGGILLLWGGLNHLFYLPKNAWTLGMIATSVVIFFVGAATSGLLKGVRIFADWNVKLFLILILYVLFSADILNIFSLSLNAIIYYIRHFVELSLWPNLHTTDTWGYQWSVFYWAIWMSWAPMTAIFLGKIARGYTVKEFLIMNFFLPSLCSLVWICLFGGLSLTYFSLETLYMYMQQNGPEAIVYFLMQRLPFPTILISIFILNCFLSFVTAGDVNTVAMADISSSADDQSFEKMILKIIWGVVLWMIAYLTLLNAGVLGIKMLSNFSGIPALFLLILVLGSLLKMYALSLYKTPVPELQEQES